MSPNAPALVTWTENLHCYTVTIVTFNHPAFTVRHRNCNVLYITVSLDLHQDFCCLLIRYQTGQRAAHQPEPAPQAADSCLLPANFAESPPASQHGWGASHILENS